MDGDAVGLGAGRPVNQLAEQIVEGCLLPGLRAGHTGVMLAANADEATRFALHLAVCAATGTRSPMGLVWPRPVSITYFAGVEDRDAFAAILEAEAARLDAGAITALASNLKVVPLPSQALDLCNVASSRVFLQSAMRASEVLIVDPLKRVNYGAGRKKEGIVQAFDGLSAIAQQFNRSVLALHTGEVRMGADTTWRVQLVGDDQAMVAATQFTASVALPTSAECFEMNWPPGCAIDPRARALSIHKHVGGPPVIPHGFLLKNGIQPYSPSWLAEQSGSAERAVA